MKNSNFITSPKTKTEKVYNVAWAVGSVGFIGGLVYAFVTKKHFWGYVGYSLLGSVAFSSVGALGGFIIIKKDAAPVDQKFSGMAGNTPNARGVKITLEQNPSGARIFIPEEEIKKSGICPIKVV